MQRKVVNFKCVKYDVIHKTWGPIYKISYDLSYDYFKFIVRSTYDSDLKRAEISLRNIISYTVVYEHYLRRYYDLARESYL